MNPGLAFLFVSGKALRSLMPFILLAAFAASFSLALSDGSVIWQLLLATELAAGVLVIAGTAMPGHTPRLLNFFIYLVQGYVASGLGAVLLLSGHGRSVWQGSTAERIPAHPES